MTTQWEQVPRRDDDEAGMAIMAVLGFAMILFIMVAVAFSTASSSVDSSVRHSQYEQAVHVAEHGIDQVLARVQHNRSYVTTTATPPAFATPADERDWAMTQLASAPVESEPRGEFAIVKPTGRQVIYAASWIPSRAAPKRTRVLKAEYVFAPHNPNKAILTASTLEIAGNPEVGGLSGHVHTNGNLTVTGSPTIDGNLTSSGSYGGSGSPSVGGEAGGGRAKETLPEIAPAKLYTELGNEYTSRWFDLCPDGKVRVRSTAPCLGAEWDSATAAAIGWSRAGSVWKKGPGAYNGVFFIHHGNADVASNPGDINNPWQATVIANQQPTSSGACTSSNGDVLVNGTPYMVPFVPNLLFVAGRDFVMNGNPAQNFTGFMGAREQLKVTGNPSVNGAMAATDLCDTTGSPVSTNYVSGNMNLTFDGNIEVPVQSIVRTTLWLEL